MPLLRLLMFTSQLKFVFNMFLCSGRMFKINQIITLKLNIAPAMTPLSCNLTREIYLSDQFGLN